MSDDPDRPWRCGVCGRDFPVPSLARDHEQQHADDDAREA
jgi:hypothetical protein